MKAVLISIQPKWVEKIASGEKTIEIKKTKPKLETPFKCYIYCTKPSKKYQTICGCMVINTDELYRLPNGKIKHDWSGELMTVKEEYTKDNFLNGKVVGEFVCNNILHSNENAFIGEKPLTKAVLEMACLTMEEVNAYRKGKNIYCWHISDLKIYDKPKALSDFWTIKCNNKRNGCQGCEIKPNCIKTITRPFQSWGYVESLGE